MLNPAIFSIKRPRAQRIPILLSAPHVGTFIPPAILQELRPEVAAELIDTDWLIHELYDFTLDMGITMIKAEYSRYVIDLNRPIEGPALYSDARRQTDAMPLTDFSGISLYRAGHTPDAGERARRIREYYQPYHQALAAELSSLRAQFSHVVLFDAHSIRRHVPAIHPQAFPDLILGDREGQTAAPILSQALLNSLSGSNFDITYNAPFKGGQITRGFGQPSQGIHALQLEMSQDIYLDPDLKSLIPSKVEALRAALKKAFLDLLIALENL